MENKPQFLGVLHNLIPVDSSDFELFPDVYDGDFFGATYSADPHYISNKLKNFQNINIIIGLLDPSYQINKAIQLYHNKFISGIINGDSYDYVNHLTSNMQNKVIDKALNIYSPQYIVHSKIFLLSNKEKTLHRVIIGSANLTNPGLGSYSQFEDIQVFDNNIELYNYYLERWNLIKKYTNPFLSNETINHLLKRKKEQLKQQKSPNNINIITTNKNDNIVNHITSEELNNLEMPVFIKLNDEEKQISTIKDLTSYAENTQEKINDGIIPQSFLEDIRIQDIKRYKDENLEDSKDYELVVKLTQELVTFNKKENKMKFEVSKLKTQKILQKINIVTIENRDEYLSRFHLTRLDNEVFPNKIEGKVIKVNPDLSSVNYSKYADKELIERGLKNIDKLIKGYQDYLAEYTNFTGKKIFEIILFAFTSPFLSKIRQSTNNNEKRQLLPLFLFIGGRGGSGKSSLLKSISKMMKDDDSIKHFIDYSKISSKTASAKTVETKNIIQSLMFENNVFPLLIDEIPVNFFESKTMGEEIIKNVSNTIDNDREEYPAFIATTNSDNYSMDEGATRRSYYIKLDIPFREKTRNISSTYHENLISKFTTDLFKDFLCRFHEKTLDNNIKYFELEDGTLDLLKIAREIFKEYYNQCEMTLPNYFNEVPFNDYKQNSQEKWLDLFRTEHKNENMFQYDKKTDLLFFTPNELNKNQKVHEARLADTYINALPAEVSGKEYNSFKVKIKGKEFFNWIGVKNPYTFPWKL